jgi:hypothetical protein
MEYPLKQLNINIMRIINFLIVIAMVSTTTVQGQDSIYNKPVERKIRTYERSTNMNGKAEDVFAFMDDVNNTGMHMTKSSGAMMGSKLKFEWLTENKTGIGSTYHWDGKVMGMKMDFTVKVNEWEKSKRKVWGTIGPAKMIVIDWFQMYLITTQKEDGKSEAKLGIYYTKHRGLWGFLLGKWYSKWCVKNMLRDTKKHFDELNKSST